MSGRRDALGRRIGPNWWRSFIVETLRCQDAVWHQLHEEFSHGYATEGEEYRQHNPRPTLKDLLISNAGMREAA